MKFYDIITEDGLVDEIDRICGSNNNNYSLKAKAARINAALDRYFSLAFESDGRWNFDDINQSSPPIDYQNIVSGTNRYKIGTFTENIINLIRLEILNSAGKGSHLTPEFLDNLNLVSSIDASGRIGGVSADTFQELYINAAGGTPTHYIKYGNFIYLRPKPNYSYTNGLLAYFERSASKFTFASFTVTVASPGVFSATAHELISGDTLVFQTTGALPAGLTAGTQYFVIAAGLTADAFEVSATLNGSAVNTSGTQSGNHSFIKTNKTIGIPEIHGTYIARYASLPYLIENSLPQLVSISNQIQIDEISISNHFASRNKDRRNRLIPFKEDNH